MVSSSKKEQCLRKNPCAGVVWVGKYLTNTRNEQKKGYVLQLEMTSSNNYATTDCYPKS